MGVTLRTCVSDADIAAVRQFLITSEVALQSLSNWDPRRWEGFCFYRDDAGLVATRDVLSRDVALAFGETQFVGAAIPEGPGDVYIQCMPGDDEVEQVLLDWAIEHLSYVEGQSRWVHVWAFDDDASRRDRLHRMGFAESSEFERIRDRDMRVPVAALEVPDGYVVRGYTDADAHGLATLLNEAFGRTYHSAQEYRNFASHAIDHRDAFEIIVEAPDGSIAANAGCNVFPDAGFGVVEPVCTHPAHQGRHLAQVAIAEGLRRVADIGIERMYVGAWHANSVSNHVYASMGFTNPRDLRRWRKEF